MFSIYISTFGKNVIKVKNGIPIEVGAQNRTSFIYPLHDNTGDNISKENEYYGELTGLYWVWKNCKIENTDIIGFCHYNKALKISNKKATEWLTECGLYGFITAKPITICNHPVSDELDCIIQLLKERNILDYDTWNKLYDNKAEAKGKYCRGGNMFITSGKVFKEYCEWLFSLLNEMRHRIGDKPEVRSYMRRYCAFMGERLLSVYIESKEIPTLDVDLKLKKWWIPILGKIRKCIFISNKNWLYRFLDRKLGNKSQYGNR